MLELSSEATTLSGILLLTAITVETGGIFLMRLARGDLPATPFQQSFARAGHGHAGMFITLGLITAVLTDATTLEGAAAWIARGGVPAAAILMPAGFFFSSMGKDRTTPNRLVWLIWLGALSLTAGLATLGIGLLTA
ncbi:hypothetical protein [Jiangella alkaliphila]|uniref:Uncharacterized protein n=1 Tax=Jiangella alkaliphila TaxID=419479 RepID=A0A1H2I7C8_9ACTN|nr:hypothetical protein [Jiangella alkaliphila]SDU39856.1 hypothetical protein SAMN04488563_1483 [Jiangella alkaliphila]